MSVLDAALGLAGAGYLVFPCRAGSKEPATAHGLKDATTEPEQITDWFTRAPRANLAVACGPQPNGLNLLVVDIDAHHGGMETWQNLMSHHDGAELRGTPVVQTPHGGVHIWLDAPPGFRNSRNRLGDGIDTRCDGGYVVVPPSRLVDGDYGGDVTAPVLAAPGWVIEALSPRLVVVPPAVSSWHPSMGGGFSAFDWVRANASWPEALARHDWQVHSNGGGDVAYTRPGKAVRDGKSAVLHASGAFVVFSTEVPAVLEGLGTATVDGTGFTVSLPDFICAYEFGGDRGLMARSVWERYGPGAPVAGGGPGTNGGRAADTVDDQGMPGSLFPDRSFYEQRPWLAMCRQMAEAVGGSPAAHVLAFLTRWATLVPPGYSIPPINGAPSSFDLLSVVAGTSGAGKSSAMRNARTLLPVIDRPDLRMNLGLGSGEGVIEAFYGMDEWIDDDGKKQRERRKMIAGVNFSISEGLIFAELAQRGGTTHVTRLCDAWSGAPLSTANARSETFRHVEEDQYRLTLMMGIQVDRAHELITDTAASQGFVGRLLFCWSEEPRVAPRPKPPIPVVLRVPPSFALPKTAQRSTWYQPVFLTYPDAVITECQDASDARTGTEVPVEEHHHDLLRLKVAGLFALMDDRMDVSNDDWELATAMCEASRAVREHLKAHRRRGKSVERHNQAVLRAETEVIIEDVKERQHVARLAAAIAARASEPMGRNALRKACCSAATKHLFDRAVQHAVAAGAILEEGGKIQRA